MLLDNIWFTKLKKKFQFFGCVSFPSFKDKLIENISRGKQNIYPKYESTTNLFTTINIHIVANWSIKIVYLNLFFKLTY